MKKIFQYSLFFVISAVVLLLLDYWMVLTFSISPVFSVKQLDGNNEIYTALWYRVWKCNDEENAIFKISSLNSKFACPLIVNETIRIIDESTSCNTAMEMFYEDKLFEYYFPCKKSDSVFIQFEDGSIELLSESLKTQRIKIDEVLLLDFEYFKVPKFEIEIKQSDDECKTKEYFREILTEQPSILYTHCVDDISIIIDEKKTSLNKALKHQEISILDIVYYMDYGHKYAEGTKENMKDGSYLYKNNNLILVQCNTFLNNNSYYFAPSDTKYQEFYCK